MIRAILPAALFIVLLAASFSGRAQGRPEVVDIPSRAGVMQRLLVLTPASPRALVVLFAGGHGGLQISPEGSFGWGAGNFLVRSRGLFAAQGLTTVIVDAPSDRQTPPFLQGFRDRPEHVADIQSIIAWARSQTRLPVWLIGTSRGTQSAAFAATRLADDDAPDGLVLTATVLDDSRSVAVPNMALDRLKLPVLVVHHQQDTCRVCRFSDLPKLMDRLDPRRSELVSFDGGVNQGDPCEARAHHGFNGLEREVVERIAGWILSRPGLTAR